MAIGYGLQVFHSVMLSLVGSLPQRERIINAINGLSTLRVDDLPAELVEEFKAFYLEMTSENLTRKVSSLTDKELREVSKKIVSMYQKVCISFARS